jgi:hypothetical protein
MILATGLGAYRRGVFLPALIPMTSSIMMGSNFLLLDILMRPGGGDKKGVQTAIGLHVMLDGYTTSYIRALAVNSSVSHS